MKMEKTLSIRVGTEIQYEDDTLTVQAVTPNRDQFFCEMDTGGFVKVYAGDIEMRPYAVDCEA